MHPENRNAWNNMWIHIIMYMYTHGYSNGGVFNTMLFIPNWHVGFYQEFLWFNSEIDDLLHPEMVTPKCHVHHHPWVHSLHRQAYGKWTSTACLSPDGLSLNCRGAKGIQGMLRTSMSNLECKAPPRPTLSHVAYAQSDSLLCPKWPSFNPEWFMP